MQLLRRMENRNQVLGDKADVRMEQGKAPTSGGSEGSTSVVVETQLQVRGTEAGRMQATPQASVQPGNENQFQVLEENTLEEQGKEGETSEDSDSDSVVEETPLGGQQRAVEEELEQEEMGGTQRDNGVREAVVLRGVETRASEQDSMSMGPETLGGLDRQIEVMRGEENIVPTAPLGTTPRELLGPCHVLTEAVEIPSPLPPPRVIEVSEGESEDTRGRVGKNVRKGCTTKKKKK